MIFLKDKSYQFPPLLKIYNGSSLTLERSSNSLGFQIQQELAYFLTPISTFPALIRSAFQLYWTSFIPKNAMLSPQGFIHDIPITKKKFPVFHLAKSYSQVRFQAR